MPERKLRVFLCHASQDKPVVRELYQRLLAEGWIDPWLDEEKLLPGQDWDMEIEKAVHSADVVVVCLSYDSINKEGYIQKEIKKALDIADEKPEETVFIIPLRIENCSVPKRLSKWQWVDYFPPAQKPISFNQLLKSLVSRADTLKIQVIESAPSDKFTTRGFPIFIFGGHEFLKIPPGIFSLGEFGTSCASPKHEFDIPYPYWIGRYAVTNGQYALFFKATGRKFNFYNEKHSHPVTHIGWNDVQGYIRWLNEVYGHQLPPSYCFRLPSETEWEKAARGNDGRVYPWGNEFSKNRCNTREGKIKDTTSVLKYSILGESPYGVANMAGNTWEWTRSIYKKYPYVLDENREVDEETDHYHFAARGGSFAGGQDLARVFMRNDWHPNIRNNVSGFRLAVTIKPNIRPR